MRFNCWVWVACLLPALCQAQSWRSSLYPEDWQRPDASVSFYDDKLIQDFSYAGCKRGEEGIPEIAGPVFEVREYGADASGATDSTAAIQAAIDAAAAAGGGVVLLPAGESRGPEMDGRVPMVVRIPRDEGGGQRFYRLAAEILE